MLRLAVCSSSQRTSTTRSSHFLSSSETFLSRCRIWTNDPGMAAIESPMDQRPIVKMWPVMAEWVFGVLLSFLTCSNCKATLPQVIHDSIKTTLSMHYWRRVCVCVAWAVHIWYASCGVRICSEACMLLIAVGLRPYRKVKLKLCP